MIPQCNFGLIGRGLLAALLLCAAPVQAQPVPTNEPFKYQDGEHIYGAICQGCHMADGKGAQGAGFYPALAENTRLTASAYPIYILLNGKNGMPPMKGYLDDARIAAVVNYVRTHFGNRYTDTVSVEDVRKLSGR